MALNTTDKKLYSSNGSAVFLLGNHALANTNLAITNVKTGLTTTNTAIRLLVSDRLQVANAVTLYATKSSPTTSGLLAHTGRATISTNLTVSGNTSTNKATVTSALTVSGNTTFSNPITYGGVTLSNAVTGTGNMVLSASPTFTGTLAAAAGTFSSTLGVTGATTLSSTLGVTGVTTHTGATTLSAALTYGGVTLSNAVTGTGNMVLSASPTLTTSATITGASATGMQLITRSSDANWFQRLGQVVNGSNIGAFYSTAGAWSVTGSTFSATKDYDGSYPTMALWIGAQENAVSGTTFRVLRKAAGASTTDGTVSTIFSVGDTGATAVTGALTYGGVTLSNSVTGTGSMVLSANPTFTVGITTPQIAVSSGGGMYSSSGSVFLQGQTTALLQISSSTIVTVAAGSVTLAQPLTYGGVTLSNSVTGTGSMVLSASPTFTGTVGATAVTAPSGNLTLRAAASNTLVMGVASGGASDLYLNGGALYPSGNNAITLGTSGNQWSDFRTITATLTGALTYGGVTLSNSVTGTGSMVLSGSPTFTGTVLGAAATFTGAFTSTVNGANFIASNAGTPYFRATDGTRFLHAGVDNSDTTYGAFYNTLNGFRMLVNSGSVTALRAGTSGAVELVNGLIYGGVTLSNSVTGTGSMVLSASPTFTGTLAAAAGTFSSTLGVTGVISVGGTGVITQGGNDVYANIRVIRSSSTYADGMYINYGGSGGSAKIYDGGTTYAVSVGTGGTLTVPGAATFSSTVTSSNEHISTNMFGFRIVVGSVGSIFYNDGSATYFLTSTASSGYGSYTAIRPIYWNNTSGLVSMNNGLSVLGGNLAVGGASNSYYAASIAGQLNVYGASSSTLARIWLGDPTDASGYVGMIRSSLAAVASVGHAVGLVGYSGIGFWVGAVAYTSSTLVGQFSANGQFGIGVTPAYALDVNGQSATYQMRISNNLGGGTGYLIGRNGADGLLYFYGEQASYNGYVFGGVNGTWMHINSTGYVGIGATPVTSAAKLVVGSGITATGGDAFPTASVAAITMSMTGNVGCIISLNQAVAWLPLKFRSAGIEFYTNSDASAWSMTSGGHILSRASGQQIMVYEGTGIDSGYGYIGVTRSGTTGIQSYFSLVNYGRYVAVIGMSHVDGTFWLGRTAAYPGTTISTAVSLGIDTSGGLRIPNSIWHRSNEGSARFYYATSSTSYFGSPNGYYVFRRGDDAADNYVFDNSGNFTALGNITSSSDLAFKSNIEIITNALDKLNSIKGITFNSDGAILRRTGVIAQDVLTVLPEAVHTNSDGHLSVAYGNMVGLLVEAIKELNQKVKNMNESKQ